MPVELLRTPRKYLAEIPSPPNGLTHDQILKFYANLDEEKYYFEDVAKAYYQREIMVSPELKWENLKQGQQMLEIAKILNIFRNYKEEKMDEGKAIAVRTDTNIVKQAIGTDEMVKVWKDYQELAHKLTDKTDIQVIQGKEFRKKSYWRKIQRAFNLSLNIISEQREVDKDVITYKFVIRATAPNGSYMDATGSCSSNEKGLLKTEHNTRAIAETRAKNRAIADLVGFGEVSAEEVSAEEQYSPKSNPKPLKNDSTAKPEPEFRSNPDEAVAETPVKKGYPTQAQIKRIYGKGFGNGYTKEQIRSIGIEKYKTEHFESLTKEQYEDFCSLLDTLSAEDYFGK